MRAELSPRFFWRVHLPLVGAFVLVDAIAWRAGWRVPAPGPLIAVLGLSIGIYGIAVHSRVAQLWPTPYSTVICTVNLMVTAAMAAVVNEPATPLWAFYFTYVLIVARASRPSVLIAVTTLALPLATSVLWQVNGSSPTTETVPVTGGIAIGALVIYGVVVNMNVRLRTSLQEAAELSQRNAADAERHRIARDLHDTLGASLTEAALWADAALGSQGEPSLVALGRARVKVGDALDELRASVRALDQGAIPASHLEKVVRARLEGLCGSAGVELELRLDVRRPTVEILEMHHLVSFLEEAVSNSVRHGRPQRISAALLVDDDLELDISDDGIGFDYRQRGAGLGLSSLRDRAGALGGSIEITSTPGVGTRLALRVPRATTPGTA